MYRNHGVSPKGTRFNEYLFFSLMASLFIAGRIGSRTSSPSGLLHGRNLLAIRRPTVVL